MRKEGEVTPNNTLAALPSCENRCRVPQLFQLFLAPFDLDSNSYIIDMCKLGLAYSG